MGSKNNVEEVKYLSNSFGKWLNEDYYTILGLKYNCTNEEINKSFKELVKKINPHKHNKDSVMYRYSEIRLKHLIKVRDTLLNPKLRENYDLTRQLSQDCYLDYLISSSTLIDKNKLKVKIVSNKTNKNVLNNYVNQSMYIYNISESELNTLDELYNLTRLFN
ncbi:MAG: DnaJ domain-containing protein [Candidatus Sericytochromatia bacterium]